MTPPIPTTTSPTPNATFESANPWNKYLLAGLRGQLPLHERPPAPFNDLNLPQGRRHDSQHDDRSPTWPTSGPSLLPTNPASRPAKSARGCPSSVSSLEWSYNPSAALSLLESSGYKLVGGSARGPQRQRDTDPQDPDRRRLDATSSRSPQTIQSELKQIGINSTVDQEPWSTYYPSILDGTYHFAVSWSNNNNATPYYEYYDLLDSSADGAGRHRQHRGQLGALVEPGGRSPPSPATRRRPTFRRRRPTWPQLKSPSSQNVPVIPLTGRANWFDYSTRYFTGWPSLQGPLQRW